jgi:hypothetical protein
LWLDVLQAHLRRASLGRPRIPDVSVNPTKGATLGLATMDLVPYVSYCHRLSDRPRLD